MLWTKLLLSFEFLKSFYVHTVPKIIKISASQTNALHKNRASHGWSRCNGVCPAFVYIQYIWHRNQAYTVVSAQS